MDLPPITLKTEHPLLMLAPMEGLTHGYYRELISEIGAVDSVATEFIRITGVNQRIAPFFRHSKTPLQIQLMASSSSILKGCILFLKEKKVLLEEDWIDLNVGCPSRRVNSRGAGAALLKTPVKIQEMLCEMRSVHKKGHLSLKTRIGFDNSNNFSEIIAALKDSPIDLLTIHARTKCGAYDQPISLNHLAYAVQNLDIPVIGNGDIFTPQDAVTMLKNTGVAGVMCGRGAISNPFIFKDIRNFISHHELHFCKVKRHRNLLFFAKKLLNYFSNREVIPNKKNKIGPYKEFATWFSRNPLIGKDFFHQIKKMSEYGEVSEFLEDKIKNYQNS